MPVHAANVVRLFGRQCVRPEQDAGLERHPLQRVGELRVGCEFGLVDGVGGVTHAMRLRHWRSAAGLRTIASRPTTLWSRSAAPARRRIEESIDIEQRRQAENEALVRQHDVEAQLRRQFGLEHAVTTGRSAAAVGPCRRTVT